MESTDFVEEAVDRDASLPDRPGAPLADRLLLALGIDPSHVLGPAAYERTIDGRAAVHS